jgi:hypothetical protein
MIKQLLNYEIALISKLFINIKFLLDELPVKSRQQKVKSKIITKILDSIFIFKVFKKFKKNAFY